MKKLIFLIVAVMCHFAGNAENIKTEDKYTYRLTGHITSKETGKPLVGATIYFPDLKKGAISDGQGYYEINGLPAGAFLIEIRYAGYSTISKVVNINTKTVKDWSLSPAIIEGQEVIVTGVSRATKVERQPMHISVINHKELLQKTSDNIIGKITDVPGVSAITTGPNVMKPVIRGLSANRVVVVNNGIRQEGQQWGAEHGIEIDGYSAGSINVIRGASSLMYGSDALGGVVQVLPHRSAPEGHVEGEIIGNYQSNNGLYAVHAAIRGNQNGLTWHANATQKAAHDYKNKYDGYVFNSKFKETDFEAGVGLNRSWGYSHLSFSSYDLKLGLPEGERDSATGEFLKEVNLDDNVVEKIASEDDFKSYNPFIGRQRVQHQKVTWDNKIYLGSSYLSATFGVQQNRRREYVDVLSPETPGLDLNLTTLNYNLHAALKEIAGWNITAGVSGMWQQNNNRGTEYLIPDYKLFEVGAYGIARKTFDKLTVSGGLRVDWRNIKAEALSENGKEHFSAFDKKYYALSGSLGLSYQFNRHWVLKANLSRGFRAPSIPELSANGVHEGTVRYENGNINLKPEESLELDAGLAFESQHVSASIYGYINNINHFIYSRKLLTVSGTDSITMVEEQRFKTFQYEQTNARLYGMEASIDIHPHPLDWLHFKNTFSYVRGIRVNGADSLRNLPQIPAASWTSELGFRLLPKGKIFRNLFVNLRLENTFRQNYFMQTYHTETTTPAYTLFDIEAGTNMLNKKGNVLFKLYFTVENLTNVAYQNHLSRLKYLPVNHKTGRVGIFNMGRNFSFKVIVPLKF